MNEKENLLDDFDALLLERHNQNHQQYLQDGIVERDGNEFGRFIRAARENVTLTRDELAMMTTMTATTIAGIEHGTITAENVDVEWVHELAESLEEEPSTLNLMLGRKVGSMVLTEWAEEEYDFVASTPFYGRWWQVFSEQVEAVRERVVGWWRGQGGWARSNWQPALASGVFTLIIMFMVAQYPGSNQQNQIVDVTVESWNRGDYQAIASMVEITMPDDITLAIQPQPEGAINVPFGDVDGGVSFAAPIALPIADLQEQGIVTGFMPNTDVTRGSAAAFIARQYQYDSNGNRVVEFSGNQIVSNASFLVRADNTAQVASNLETLAINYDGVWLGANTIPTEFEQAQMIVIFEVPPENFNDTIEQIRAMNGTIITENIVAQKDVTSQYVDLDARLRNLELAETELQDLLASSEERGDDAEEILSVHGRLVEVRGQVEQLKGQLAVLERSIAMSRITVTLIPEEAAQGFQPERILQNAWDNFVDFLQWIVSGLLWLLAFSPAIIVAILLIVIVWKVVKRRSGR